MGGSVGWQISVTVQLLWAASPDSHLGGLPKCHNLSSVALLLDPAGSLACRPANPSPFSKSISITPRDEHCTVYWFISERELTHAIARPSACNVRVPFSGGSYFRQYFYDIRSLGHPLTSTENFTEIVPRGTPPPGELNTRGVAKYNHFRPIDGYISETVQDRR